MDSDTPAKVRTQDSASVEVLLHPHLEALERSMMPGAALMTLA